MKISVLMSVYKSEKPAYLDRSLQSVWDDQIQKPDEIILVQDGPLGDDLLQVITKWQEKLGGVLVRIVNEVNIGLTKSLNKGIKVAQGEYIARMDSDDISLPERFGNQVDFLDKHHDISVVGSYIQEFSDSCDNLGIRKFPLDTEGAKKIIYKANPLAHPAVMMKKNLFDEGISYNEEYRTSQDLALWFDVLAAGYKVANIDKVLLKFRRNDSVYKRRSNRKDSNLELKVHEKGILKLYGFSPYKSLFPIMRYIIRLLPSSIIRRIYNGSLRQRIAE